MHHSSPPKTSPPAHHPSPPKVSPPPASTSLLLGLPSFHKIVVDDAHQHVFVSGGTNSPSEQTKPTVLVATSTGTVVKRFTGLPSAWGMALSSATHQLFVALPAIGKVAVIDTATLTVTRMLAAPADAAPTNLTIAGGLLWISSPEVLSEPDRGRELLTVDPADLDAGIQWADPLGGFDWVLGAPFLASPATGNLLAVATESNSTSSSVRLYRVNRTALTPVGREFLLQAEADDLAFTPDGRYLTMVRRGGPMYRFSTADPPPNWDLIMAGEYNFWGPAQPPPSSRGCDAGGHETLAGVYTADGKTFIGGPSASFYPADSGHPTTTSDLPGCQLPHGLAVDASASRVFSVATSAQGLRLVTVPGPDSSAVSHLPALPLGLQTAYAAVVDPVNRHIFVSPGELGNEIAVLDFSGHLLKLIPNMYGAQQLALSPRLGKLYAALSTGNGVAEIDTRTLTETRRFTAGIRTQQVLLSGGRLWARVRIGNDLPLASLDPSQPDPSWVAAGQTPTSFLWASSGEQGNTIVALNGTPIFATYTVSGTTVTLDATHENPYMTLDQPIFTPDGSAFYAETTNGDHTCGFRVSDASQIGCYGVQWNFDSPLAISPDGKTLLVMATIYEDGADPYDQLQRYDIASGQLLATAPVTGGVAATSPDQREVFVLVGGGNYRGDVPPTFRVFPAP